MSNLTIQQKLRAMGGYFDNATETQISCKDVADYIDALQAELESLRQQLASSEPVAYRHLHDDGWEYYDAPTGSDCSSCKALFTTPQQPQSVADALEEAAKICDDNLISWADNEWNDALEEAAKRIRALIKRNAVKEGE